MEERGEESELLRVEVKDFGEEHCGYSALLLLPDAFSDRHLLRIIIYFELD